MTRRYIPGETMPRAEYIETLRRHARIIGATALTQSRPVAPDVQRILDASDKDLAVAYSRNIFSYDEVMQAILKLWNAR